MRNISCSISKSSKTLNLLTLLWVFSVSQLFLFDARTKGFWFDSLLGILTSILILLTIVFSFLTNPNQHISKRGLVLYFFLLISLMLAAVFSTKIISGDYHAVRKLLSLLPYVAIAGFWGLFFNKEMINEKHLIIFSALFLILGNALLFEYYSGFSFVQSFRIGAESNANLLAYALANLWIFILVKTAIGKNPVFFSLVFIAGFFNILLVQMRQPLAYFSLVFIILLFIFSPLSISLKTKTYILFSIPQTKKLIFLVFSLLVFLSFLMLVVPAINQNQLVKKSLEISLSRWSSFKESNFFDENRFYLIKQAIKVWENKPLVGSFSYEEPGLYAHNMLIDSFAQYGFLGGLAYLFLVIFSLIKLIKDPKEKLINLSFALFFIGLLFMGLSVTTLVGNPIFHFLLFYWVTNKQVSKEGPSY